MVIWLWLTPGPSSLNCPRGLWMTPHFSVQTFTISHQAAPHSTNPLQVLGRNFWGLTHRSIWNSVALININVPPLKLRVHYVVKVTKNRVRPCSAVILPSTWGCTLLDCKSKKISSNMVRSGLKIRPKYEAYFIRQPIEGIILEKSLFHEKCSQLYT